MLPSATTVAFALALALALRAICRGLRHSGFDCVRTDGRRTSHPEIARRDQSRTDTDTDGHGALIVPVAGLEGKRPGSPTRRSRSGRAVSSYVRPGV